MKKLTVGILAHVDSGKTTLTEALLYTCGNLRHLGRVDKKDTFLDTYSLERERGITIFSKQALLNTSEFEITLIDTPGHVDFSPEAERTLDVLDAAILVISATAGVQSHTQTLWRLLSKHKIPTLIFVNKSDLPNADIDAVMRSLRKKLSPSCVEARYLGNYEECAVCSETLMEAYLEKGGISTELIKNEIAKRRIFPCCIGSALKLDGIEEFVKLIDTYLREPVRNKKFGARVFKITRDNTGNRLVHLKITGSGIAIKDIITGVDCDGNEWQEKINSIRIYSGDKFTACDFAEAGSVCAVTGLTKVRCGEVLGEEKQDANYSLEPVLSYRLIVPKTSNIQACFEMLKAVEDQEPTLHVSFNKYTGELNVLLMGEIQLEVLKHILKERFNFDAEFTEGTIVYRETIASTVEGVGHFEPLRHYAEVHLLLEPLPRGSGLVFDTDCSESDLARNWQRLILTHLEEKIHKGVLTGSAITDMKISLVSGKAHKKHTEGGDFREATYRAVRHGLRCASGILLEPWYNFELVLPSGMIGRAMTDLEKFGADFSAPEICDDIAKISGSAPVAKLKYYSLELAGYTHGKGTLVCTLKGYEECHNANEVIQQTGYNPDEDLLNPCSSVFCANGAGFIVQWDEVFDYMHLESVLEYNSESAEQQRIIKKQAENFCKNVATDKELMEIFERTYGKIKPKETQSKAKLNPSAKAVKPANTRNNIKTYAGKEYLLIDGYNIIFAWQELKDKARDSLESARAELINRMINYQGFLQSEIMIVFDAYRVKKNPGSIEKVGNIHVVYTKEAETADTYIERVSKTLSKQYRVRVATSDGPEQMIILGNGALRVPAAALKKEVTDAENAIKQIMENFS